MNSLPNKLSGLTDWTQNQKKFEKDVKIFKPFVSTDLIKSLKTSSIKNENLLAKGVQFLRKKTNVQTIYFLANQNTIFHAGTLTFNILAKNVYIFDPISGKRERLNFTRSNNKTNLNLYLPSGKSAFIIFTNQDENSKPLEQKIFSKNKEINGNWQLFFKEGAPFLPKTQSLTQLESWTNTNDTSAHYFSGIGEYTIQFYLEKEAVNKSAILALGDVRESAKVYLNNIEIGTAWSLPFELEVPENILKEKNELKIEVRNVSVNRVIYLDKQKIEWKRFYDINMVDIQYKPFDASKWKPVDSGLLGPVILKY